MKDLRESFRGVPSFFLHHRGEVGVPGEEFSRVVSGRELLGGVGGGRGVFLGREGSTEGRGSRREEVLGRGGFLGKVGSVGH